MDKLIDNIINKEFKEAENSLREELASLVERKLGEKKKMMTSGDTPFKSPGEMGQIKAKRKPLKGVTKVLKDIKEQIVQKDGLIHLATGEKVLPSVYRQRRWLAESDEWSDQFADRHGDLSRKLSDDQTNPARKAIKQHLDKAEKYQKDDPEKAEDHLRQAEKLHDMSHGKNLKEDSKTDDKHFKKQPKKVQDMLNSLMRRGHSYGEAKAKLKLKEDYGLDPDKKEKVEAALMKAKMLLQPQLDTTALDVDRTKLTIPKGKRPADRLTAPDLGPKEDEWMHGRKLEEAVSRKHFRDVANLLKEIPDEKKRKELAHHHAGIFAGQNPRFDKKKFLDAAGVKEDE